MVNKKIMSLSINLFCVQYKQVRSAPKLVQSVKKYVKIR